MQYYQKLMKNSADSQNGNSVICLNRILSICVEKANAIYSCKTDFICPKEIMYIEENVNTVVEIFGEILDRYCTKFSEITVKLARDTDGRTAILQAFEDSGNELCRTEFKLYTGIPRFVIRDPELDEAVSKLADEIFAKILTVRKKELEKVDFPEK